MLPGIRSLAVAMHLEIYWICVGEESDKCKVTRPYLSDWILEITFHLFSSQILSREVNVNF
ncbi:hypothetical protein [Photorhabdus australis]|uniref:hypothetical protein n=1 Tax=Photorhabdus australis TaxID=286156 RepID=UPI0030DA1CDA